MRRTLVLLALLYGLAAPSARAGEEASSPAGVVVPTGAKITLEVDRRTFFLGETIHLRYRIQNDGHRRIEVDRGGDYRASPRHLRFRVEVTDTAGRRCVDPYPNPFCLGGVGGPKRIEPGEDFAMPLRLGRYARLERAGTYRVRVSHDLGWDGDWMRREKTERPPDDPRWAEVTLELKQPNEAEARALLAPAFEAYAKAVGRHDAPPFDFHTLTHPLYLPLLLERVEGDDRPAAFDGISSIATPEATEGLLALLESEGVSKEVAALLNFRLPDPQLTGELPARHVFANSQASRRRFFVEQSWQGEFADRVRTLAKAWLAHATIETAGYPAYMLEAVGEAEDLPVLVEALDRAVWATVGQPVEEGIYPRPRGSCHELLRAVRILLRRGGEVPVDPSKPGEIVTCLLARDEGVFVPPDDFDERLAGWLDHGIPYVQEQVLLLSPRPLPAGVLSQLGGLLSSGNLDVRITALVAIQGAGPSAASRFRDRVLERVARATDDQEIRSADAAAHALEVPLDDLYEIWIDRMAEAGRLRIAFGRLQPLFEHRGGHGWSGEVSAEEITRLQESWWAFLAENRDLVRLGHRFGPNDPAVTEDLWPSGFEWHPR